VTSAFPLFAFKFNAEIGKWIAKLLEYFRPNIAQIDMLPYQTSSEHKIEPMLA
jgi:hypothetical protein